ncbi:MAG: hypothetical protein AB7O50_11150 [Pseudolabrys sp.]
MAVILFGCVSLKSQTLTARRSGVGAVSGFHGFNIDQFIVHCNMKFCIAG